MRQKSLVRNNIIRILLSLAACTAIGYGFLRIGGKVAEYMESAEFYNAMRDEVTLPQSVPASPNWDNYGKDDSSERREQLFQNRRQAEGDGCERYLTIDWDSLSGTDVIGWLELYDVDYPILQAEDNAYYLHRLPDGTWNYGGSIFLNAFNDKDFADQNSFVYGHNMADGSMFGTLLRYLIPDYGDGEFRIYYPDGRMDHYRILSVSVVDSDSKAFAISFDTEKDFIGYQEYMKSISRIPTDVLPSEKARLVTLSTCFGMQGTSRRLLVTGQCVPED